MNEATELAWGIIANAYGGNWDEATPEWRDAACRWRDRFVIDSSGGEVELEATEGTSDESV